MAGGLAAPLSFAAAGLGGIGKIMGGAGEQAAQDYLADRDQRAAELGRIRADQTDSQMREDLNRTLATIDAVRASANTDPFSPTALAVKDEQARLGNRERTIKVAGIQQQVAEDEATARYRRTVGDNAFNMGLIGGIAGIGKQVATGMK